MDSGGSFDYKAWQCSRSQSLAFAEISVWHFVSFWLLGLAVLYNAVSFVALLKRGKPPNRSIKATPRRGAA